MKNKFLTIILLLTVFTAQQVLAQGNCTLSFKNSLEKLSGVHAVTNNENGFLAILDSSSSADIIKAVSRIKALRADSTVSGCDFSDISVTVMDRNFEEIKSGTSEIRSDKKLSTLLYKYVYALSPVNAELNLRGYEKLCELSPQNTYYAARKKHYEERLRLIKDRSGFIELCEREARNDKSIIDLKIKKDFYLFITDTDTPLRTAEKFLDKIAEKTPRPDKKMCIIAYSADLRKREVDCPEEYKSNLAANEEELMVLHVQALPGFMIKENLDGYAALRKINPNASVYGNKLKYYEIRLNGLERFAGVNTAAGDKLFSESSNRGNTMFATINRAALDSRSESDNLKLFRTIAAYYQHCGSPFDKCVLKNSAGDTLGTIFCGKSGCSFR